MPEYKNEPKRLRQGHGPLCPVHLVPMTARSSPARVTYFKCPFCDQRKKLIRPTAPPR